MKIKRIVRIQDKEFRAEAQRRSSAKKKSRPGSMIRDLVFQKVDGREGWEIVSVTYNHPLGEHLAILQKNCLVGFIETWEDHIERSIEREWEKLLMIPKY